MDKMGVKILLILLLTTGVFKAPVFGQVMTSTNFKIQRDSINFGGGYSSSTNFQMEDSVGEIATGYSSSTIFLLHAGYQQMDIEKYLTITAPSAVTLLPVIPGLSGGTASGTSAVHVITNNNSGYVLQIKASSSPAMNHISESYSFVDYTLPSAVPEFTWDIPATSSEFGFSPEGTDIVANYLDNGNICNQSSGSDTVAKCWDFLLSDSKTIAQSVSTNASSGGSTTTVRFQAQNGSEHIQPSGTYRAEITVTAYMN
ncbi:MAG: hypothetical protein Q7J14_00710 [Candidatus Magasanikbacteria bacterium]|nr:hypothetical protein [Candidatus Magasanikbacteria bacterium]